MKARSQPRGEGQPEMASHLEDQEGEPERNAEPEAPPEIDELRTGSGRRVGHHGLERHPAHRTVPRGVADDLRVHRAGVEDALGHRLGRGPGLEELARCRLEARPAPLGTEEEHPPGMLRDSRREGALDAHPAHRVFRLEVVAGGRRELVATRVGTEPVPSSRVVERERAGRRCDLHPADGIAHERLDGGLGGSVHPALGWRNGSHARASSRWRVKAVAEGGTARRN